MYTYDDLIADVKIEAQKLKAYATKDELQKLNWMRLSPLNAKQCFYGQMTGSCFSQRAAELIENCCERYFKRDALEGACIESRNANVDEIIANVNGIQVDGFFNNRTTAAKPSHYSSIEVYIAMEGANYKSLLAFLKDETQTLEL